jgi:hypothetical protein
MCIPKIKPWRYHGHHPSIQVKDPTCQKRYDRIVLQHEVNLTSTLSHLFFIEMTDLLTSHSDLLTLLITMIIHHGPLVVC